MPYTLKTNQISVKDPETGKYSGVDILAEQTEQGLIAELQAEGTTQVNRINQAAVDVQSAVDKAETDAAKIISDTQASVNTLEAQKNTIAQTVASMAELGTDTTLSTPGMAADAGAVGDLKSAFDKTAMIEEWNLLADIVPTENVFLNEDGTTRANSLTFIFEKIPIEPDTKYYLYNEQNANYYSSNGYDNKYCARTVVFYDENNNAIGNAGGTYTRSPLTTPTTAKYMSICGTYLNDDTTNGIGTNWLTTKAIDKHEDSAIVVASVPIGNVIGLESKLIATDNSLKRLNLISAQLPNRKPTFTFIFDDGTDGDINVKALFDSYGLKCGFGIIVGNYSGADLEQFLSRYLPYQADGFEILSHSVNETAFTSLTDLTLVESYLKDSIDRLKSWGFDVNGWVTPSTWLLEEQMPLVQKYYQYGYGHLSGTPETIKYHSFIGLDVRQLDRWDLEGHTIEETMAKIDEAITNNAYMIFNGHFYPSTTNNMTTENMNTILTYLKAKEDAGDIFIGTPRETINYYYSFRHSDLLDLYNLINS